MTVQRNSSRVNQRKSYPWDWKGSASAFGYCRPTWRKSFFDQQASVVSGLLATPLAPVQVDVEQRKTCCHHTDGLIWRWRCMSVCVYVWTYIYTIIYICIYICPYLYVYIHIHAYVYAHVKVQVYLCMCIPQSSEMIRGSLSRPSFLMQVQKMGS